MTAKRELILAQVKTDCEAIDGSGVFATTVAAVSRNVVSATGLLARAETPGIVIIDKGDEPTMQASHQERYYILGITLALALKRQPGESTATALNNFVADAVYAMTAPTYRTHSDTCIHTEHKGTNIFAVEGDATAWALVDFDITYNNTWTAP